jgi:DNA-binding NtrC family response regulator
LSFDDADNFTICEESVIDFSDGMPDLKEQENKHTGQGRKFVLSEESDVEMWEMEKQEETSLSLEKISNVFHVSVQKAAEELKVGTTTLHNKCRELGIGRWPNRKLKSLQALIDNIQVSLL